MKDLTHYFGQSPPSDGSSPNLKENEANCTFLEDKNVVKKASSDVLKCKTLDNSTNIEDEPFRRNSQTDVLNESQKKNSSGKRKYSARKKAIPKVSDESGANVDEEFVVKSVTKSGKKRGRPRKIVINDPPVQETKQDAPVPVKGNESKASISNVNNSSLEQLNVTKKESTLASPILDDSAFETKPKTAKNIMHFFSPSKSSRVQSSPSEVSGDQDNSKDQSNASELFPQHKEEAIPSKRTSVKSGKETLLQLEEKSIASEEIPQKRGRQKLQTDKEVETSISEKSDDKAKAVSTRKSRKSLSSKEKNKETVDSKELNQSVKNSSDQDTNEVKSSVSIAFQMLMSKKLLTSQISTDPESGAKNEGSQSSNVLPEKEQEDDLSLSTPSGFIKRKKRNRIESDSEEDGQTAVVILHKKVATEAESTSTQDESKRKSLMKYFSKISKEEAEIQSQKVQFKVEAIVHHSDGSPYKSKSKNDAGKVQKRKKVRTRVNENEIEWLGSEEITVEENKSKGPGTVPEVKEECAVENIDEKSAQVEDNRTTVRPQKGKQSLKLDSKSGSRPRSKRPTKALESSQVSVAPDKNSKLPVEVENVLSDVHSGSDKTSLPNSSKMAAKKLKQVSLTESPFLKKHISDNTSEKSNLKYNEEKCLSTEENTGEGGRSHVLVTSNDSKLKSPLQESREIIVDSSCSPSQTELDTAATPTRSWKLKINLTPRAESSSKKQPTGSYTIDAGCDDEVDVQEIAVIKKKKKQVKAVKSGNPPKANEKDVDQRKGSQNNTQSPAANDKSIEIVYEEKDISNESKDPVKLAPLFMRPKKLDRISEQAKQEFLQSGVPDQVKKMMEVQRSMESVQVELFPLVSHVTQLESISWTPSTADLPLRAECSNSDPIPSEPLKMGDMTSCDPVGCEMVEVLSSCSTSLHRQKRRIAMKLVPSVLSVIRAEDPDCQVVRYFKLLREKYRKVLDTDTPGGDTGKRKRSRSSRRSRNSNQGMDSPKRVRTVPSLMWTDKYRPTTSDDFIGNKETVDQLKRWLEALRRVSQSGQTLAPKPKRSRKTDYSDDFIVSDENCDSNSSSACISNSALLVGPNGSGKTNCVYALAADLGYKVLEINASERRNGKIILAKLSEATQSHQVAGRSQEANSSVANFFGSKSSTKPKPTKRKLEKKSESEDDSTKNKLSLILIKDIDIVFEEEDEGFVTAVASLVSTSKRPVIFTTTEADCPHLKRVINSSTLLLEFSPDSKALCSWLQIIALVEGLYISRNALNDLLTSCKGDVRQCLLQLQIWMSTGGNHLLEPAGSKDNRSVKDQDKILLEEFLQGDIREDDLSKDLSRSSLTPFEHYDCVGALQGRNDIELMQESNKITIPAPMSFGRVWWNIPSFLSLPQIKLSEIIIPDPPAEPRRFKGIFDDSIFDMASDDEANPDLPTSQPKPAEDNSSQETEKTLVESGFEEMKTFDVERCTQEEMDAVLAHMQAMSTCDLIASASGLPEVAADFEPIPRYWRNHPRDSLSQSIPVTCGPDYFVEETSRSLCHWLAESSINHARSVLLENPKPRRYDPLLPDLQIERRRLNVTDAEKSAVEAAASCVRLERRSLALDYLPVLKRICISEKKRFANNSCRRNRFYHYFKNIGLYLSAEQESVFTSS